MHTLMFHLEMVPYRGAFRVTLYDGPDDEIADQLMAELEDYIFDGTAGFIVSLGYYHINH